MWSCETTALTRRSALVAVLMLAGCGYVPVYGTGGAGNVLRGTIAYQVPETVDGFNLGKRLQDRLGRTGGATYVLAVTLTVTEAAGAIDSTNTSTRISLPGTADWTLTDRQGTIRANGEVSTFTGYSNTGSTVATRTAREDARARLMTSLADLIVTQLFAASPTL